jgi:hypothetical protein
MAQTNDQTVQNATFPTVRADINNNLAALFSANSGNTAPTFTVAFQDWISTNDPNNKVWYKRNAANNAWITVATITGSAIAFEGTLPSQTGNAGEYLTTDGTVASWGSIVSGINAANVFASSGNWTCPAGVQKVLVTVIGGGGGGRGGSGGGFGGSATAGKNGGHGGYGTGVLTVTPGTVYTVTIGSGGAGKNSSTNGSAGGTSTFGTISATGGGGGTSGAVGANGSCSSSDATLRRSNISLAIPFLVNGTDITRPSTAGTAAVAWAVTSTYSPGSLGAGGAATANSSGSGGVGGAVLLLY